MNQLLRRTFCTLARWKWRIAAVYLLLLLASYIFRWTRMHTPLVPDELASISVHAIRNDSPTPDLVRIAYREYAGNEVRNSPVVVLIHGSPGSERDFDRLAPLLARNYRVIVPDLPGFGFSTHDIPDYSNRAHARYLIELLDQLHVQKAHVVGFSMGGGAVLNLAAIAPDRVTSLTMMSAIGVQEMELLGNYYLNHSLHGAQLGMLWLLHNAIPHFGWLDHSMLDLSYARNFFDTDQRPLRKLLIDYPGPMLIIHGEQDIMVPVEVAREDYRLVPQSELHLLSDENHFYLFGNPTRQAEFLISFVERVETNHATTRTTASAERVTASQFPFNPTGSIPRAMGPTALVLFFLLALATLISEDLTCIWAGVMVAEGRISFLLGAVACLLGIFIGDLLLFLAGRFIGRPALSHPPLKWFVRESDVVRGSQWFRRRGMAAIAISRFIPGTRLPTYFAAGLLDTSLLKFAFYFLIAAGVWTPLLVAGSMLVGREVIETALITPESLFLRAAILAFAVFVFVRLLLQMSTFRGRRLLVGRWRRLTHWEFWPPWFFYPPVVLYILYLGLKHKGLTVFTCANPAIEESGFVGESKSAILRGLAQQPNSDRWMPATLLLKQAQSNDSRVKQAEHFMTARSLSYPVVMKPDVGERGFGVAVIRSREQLLNYLRQSATVDIILQEHAPGLEFGVFYYRYPNQANGKILSITRKLFPSVIGDGHATLENLILKDKRAVSMARTYFEAVGDRLWDVPLAGDSVQLIEIGTHCRGSIFLDGMDIKTECMEKTIDKVARGFNGFYFGRFDIRTPSLDDFQAGHNFKIVELNGVTSEATSIYDPRNGLLQAYRTLFEQWRIAFAIGAQNRILGFEPASIRKLTGLVLKKWSQNGESSGQNLRLKDQKA
jgi:pimeloyl-ACP methyl ester carboxylesterase/membrane protein DedA with SNARE-associated domain